MIGSLMSNNILIVEDEKYFARLMAKILKEDRFNTVIANTVNQALNALNNFKPDLVLLDIKLPHSNEGIDFLRKFRDLHEYSETPVLVLSAKVQLHEISDGIEAGATKYLCKPMSIKEIIKEIRYYLSE
jgi:DNA-binding response OmpR family regulator